MTKEERLKWIKERHRQFMAEEAAAVILPTQRDIEEEVALLSGYQEELRDKKTIKTAPLTSDEK